MELITKKQAIEALGTITVYKGSIPFNTAMMRIEQLPPAQPEPKRGKWIKISPANIYECSECGKSVMTSDICAYGFCHGCGAKMELKEDE